MKGQAVAIKDPVVIRDQNGIWKPAIVIETAIDGFIAEWKLNAGADTITVRYDSAIAWKYANAAVPA